MIDKEKLRTAFNRRIRKLDINPQAKGELFERFLDCWNNGFKCAYCEKRMELKWGDTELAFSIDHVLARLHGGTDSVHNLCFCCSSCNSMKSDHDAGWFACNVNRLKARKKKRDFFKARKTSKKDEGARAAFKGIFEMVTIEKGRKI